MIIFDEEKLKEITEQETTDLCTIMTVSGTDKGSGHHNYTKLYHHLFSERRKEKLNILEIGIGSVKPDIPSSMVGSKDYKPGASIRGWLKYFPNATVYACDIDKDILAFPEERAKGFFMDQRDSKSILDKFYKGDLRDVEFDLIIDDGLHNFPINWNVLKLLLPKVKEGGWYIIENIIDYNPRLINRFEGQYISLPNSKNNIDNNLFVVTKKLST